MTEEHKLPDVLERGLRVVFCGTAAGTKSAAVRAYYAGPGNQFWPTLHAVGLTPRQLAPSEFLSLLRYGIGLTDIAKFRAGSDASLLRTDFDVPSFRAKITEFSPAVIAFNGKAAAAAFYECKTCDLSYGPQADRVSTTAIWVLPSTSGSARGYWEIGPWRDLATTVAVGKT